MAKKGQYEELVRRYLDNKASDDELAVFFDLLKKGKIKKQLDSALKREEAKMTGAAPEGGSIADAGGKAGGDEGERKIGGDATIRGVGRRIGWGRLAAAAAVIGVLLTVGVRYVIKTSKRSSPQDVSGIQYSHDIQPARNHALLTTPGGKVIDLDSNAASTVLLQGGARLVKNASGEWIYRSGADVNGGHGRAAGGVDRGVGGDDNATVYNTISAPRGGQFSFVLEDGTRVWLNASSSMRFPTAFRGKAREVTVEGEAYLEVARNMSMPFLVQAGGVQVRVLGTRFNVNAYTDEPEIRTTLLDGAVQIIKDKTEVMLQPGEQASCKPDGTVNTVKDPDVVDAAMAWRSGYFSFDKDNIQTVMRQISRWYDVDIRYEGPVTKAVFGGDLGRDLTLVQVLRVLEKSQVHFRLDGNVLTILS